MSENIVAKISAAEKEATKSIEEAMAKARSMIEKARIDFDGQEEIFEKESREILKKFKEDQIVFYNKEASELEKVSLGEKDRFEKEISDKLGSISKKVKELIDKELCL